MGKSLYNTILIILIILILLVALEVFATLKKILSGHVTGSLAYILIPSLIYIFVLTLPIMWLRRLLKKNNYPGSDQVPITQKSRIGRVVSSVLVITWIAFIIFFLIFAFGFS